jgi:PAS domain S-box-containing protein
MNLDVRLEKYKRYQEIIAGLGCIAINEDSHQNFINQAANLICQALEAQYCKVLKFIPEKDEFLLEGGFGWKKSLNGKIIIKSGNKTHAGYALLKKEPIIIKNLNNENRFSNSFLLNEHNIVSGLNFVIKKGEPYGVVGVYTSEERTFTIDEMEFLEHFTKIMESFLYRKKIEEANANRHKLIIEQASVSDSLNSRIIEAIPSGIVMVSCNGKIMKANHVAQRILGLSFDHLDNIYVEEFKTKTIWEDGSECKVEDYPVSKCLLENKEQPPATIGVKRPDGEISWAIFTALPVNDNNSTKQTGALVTFVDITERKKIEEELRNSELKLRYLSNAVFEGIVISENGIILEVNQACADMLGCSVSEIIGKNVAYCTPDVEIQKIIDNIRSGNESSYESKAIKKDGTIFPVEIRGKQIPYQSRNLRVTIIRDISRYKEAEKQIRKSLYEKEILLKEIHHRVKNNLQIISSLLYLQSRKTQDNNVIDIFKESQNRIRSMSFIHEKLYQAKELDKIDFLDYINELSTNLIQSYGVKKNHLTLKIEVENVLLDISTAIPCGLIINELLVNSLKYAFPDSNPDSEVLIKLYQENDNFALVLSDNGIGFPENIDFRETETLGLQLVILLIEQISGKMEMIPSKGTTFKITFKS